eukprot:129698_1
MIPKTMLMAICGWSAITVYGCIEGESTQYVLKDPLAKYCSDDYSAWTPPIETGGRVVDLLDGEFFDEHLRDTPDHMRPPAVVAFYDSFDEQCYQKYQALDFDDTANFHLPSRAFLFASRYDMGAAPKRTWYKFISERDLAKRMGVTQCPSIVFVPPECNGFTEWCERETIGGVTYLGCDDYVDQCAAQYSIWTLDDEEAPDYKDWLTALINGSRFPQIGGPKLSGPNKKQFESMQEQERWLQSRDASTQRENYRNNWVASALPSFSQHGFKAMTMSKEHRQEFIQFYKKWQHKRGAENWNSFGQTAVNGHEVEPSMVRMDNDYQFKDYIVNKYVKPKLEEWVGFPLQLSSHYGIREYYDGSFLKNHVDRIDVLVISATQSVAHIECNTTADGFCQDSEIDFEGGWREGVKWPLEGVDWQGNNVRYDHPPGTMVMYESAKFIHGRPYRLPQHPNHPKQKYVHLGAFSHFTPADGSWKIIGHDTNARRNLNRNTKGTHYRSNPQYYPPEHYQTFKDEL